MDNNKSLIIESTLPLPAKNGKPPLPKPVKRPPVLNNKKLNTGPVNSNKPPVPIISKKPSPNGTNKGLFSNLNQKANGKARTYNESSSQTNLTAKDIVNCATGIAKIDLNSETITKSEKNSQTNGSLEELRLAHLKLQKTTVEEDETTVNENLLTEVEKLRAKLEKEQTDLAFVRSQLQKSERGLLSLLLEPVPEQLAETDRFLEQAQAQAGQESNEIPLEQVIDTEHVEITNLLSLCVVLSKNLEKTIAAKKAAIKKELQTEAIRYFLEDAQNIVFEIALQEAENDSLLLLSFELERQAGECKEIIEASKRNVARQRALLQRHQKTLEAQIATHNLLEQRATLVTALKETESQVKKIDESIQQPSSEVERQTEDCKRLIGINGQERQGSHSLECH